MFLTRRLDRIGEALNTLARRGQFHRDQILKAISETEKRSMDKIDAVSAKFDELARLWNEHVALLKANIQKQIDDAKAQAVADDDAEEAVRLDALAGRIQGEIDALPKPFDPSGNAD